MAKRRRHSKPSPIIAPALPTKTNPNFRALTIKYGGITNRIVTDVGLTPAFDPKDYQNKEPPYQILEKKSVMGYRGYKKCSHGSYREGT